MVEKEVDEQLWIGERRRDHLHVNISSVKKGKPMEANTDDNTHASMRLDFLDGTDVNDLSRPVNQSSSLAPAD